MSICLNTEMCTGCGLCVEVCSPQAIYLLAGKAVLRPELCTACGDCVKVCAPGAITIVEPPALIRPVVVQAPAMARVARNTSQAPGKIALWTGIAATVIEQHILPRSDAVHRRTRTATLIPGRCLQLGGQGLCSSNGGRD
jgi:NAD-dependent dihydropyrimidine dehydrogenase PreA subunit